MIKVPFLKLETLEHSHLHSDMKEIKVEGHPDLVRDSSSKAIVNKNQTEYENYMKINRVREAEKNKIKNIESDLSSLRSEINEIKSLLITMINK
mgnify:CR=1 FL=1